MKKFFLVLIIICLILLVNIKKTCAEEKSKLVGTLYSLILPGAGHIYIGEKSDYTLPIILTQIVLDSIIRKESIKCAFDSERDRTLLFVSYGGVVICKIFELMDLYKLINQHNEKWYKIY